MLESQCDYCNGEYDVGIGDYDHAPYCINYNGYRSTIELDDEQEEPLEWDMEDLSYDW